MSSVDQYFSHVPRYDDYMYLRGYSPEEIYYAHHKQLYEEYNQKEEDEEISLIPKVRIKK